MEKQKTILNKRSTFYVLRSTNAGFTLVEMMVSIFIFSLILLASTGAVLAVVSANANVQGLQSVSNNFNFALESMVRAIRLGYSYQCGNDETAPNCPLDANGANSVYDKTELRLRDYSSKEIGFRVFDYKIQKYSGGQYIDMTSPEVQISRLAFFVSGVGADKKWPTVTIVVTGKLKYKNRKIPFSVETGATQRRFEEVEFNQ